MNRLSDSSVGDDHGDGNLETNATDNAVPNSSSDEMNSAQTQGRHVSGAPRAESTRAPPSDNAVADASDSRIITVNSPGFATLRDMAWVWELLHVVNHTVLIHPDAAANAFGWKDGATIRRHIDRIRQDHPNIKLQTTTMWGRHLEAAPARDTSVRQPSNVDARPSGFLKKQGKAKAKKEVSGEKESDGPVSKRKKPAESDESKPRKKVKLPAPGCDLNDLVFKKEDDNDEDEDKEGALCFDANTSMNSQGLTAA